MNKKNALLIQMEVAWWIVTGLVTFLVLYPIIQVKPSAYPFWIVNISFIIIFVTLTRYLFLLKHTFLAYLQWLKVVVLLCCIPLMFLLVEKLHHFKNYMDKIGLEPHFNNLPLDKQAEIINYIDSEMIFFGIGSIIVAVLMPFRMLVSFWRTHNRGTV